MAEASIHLSCRTCIENSLHWPIPRISWSIWVPLAVTYSWIAHTVGVDSTQQVLIGVKWPIGTFFYVVFTYAVCDSIRASLLDIFGPQLEKYNGVIVRIDIINAHPPFPLCICQCCFTVRSVGCKERLKTFIA